MAEGFGSYHVPQQSRRDKLRIMAQNHPQSNCVYASSAANLQGLFPLYDPSFLSSDLLTCSGSNNHAVVKQEHSNLMGFLGASSSSTFLDPQASLSVNPNAFDNSNDNSSNNNNNNPFVYTPQNFQNFRDFTQGYNSGDMIVFRPEQPLSLNKESNITQGLSLSLSSHYAHQNNLPLELNLQRYGSSSSVEGLVVPRVAAGSASTSNDASRSLVPLGPFTGYASILKGSRFLKPAQQLLEELCNVGVKMDSALMDLPPMESFSADDSHSSADGIVGQPRKSRLLLMLEEVYRRYKQYYQQMQAALASFEYVAGLGNAAPYAHLALKTMCKHFMSLKNAITDQLQFSSSVHGQMGHGKDETLTFGNTSRGINGQRYLEHQPVWRPQRGLPEHAVTILRAWLFEHFLHPYPTDTDKLMLAKQTGLSRNQVSNWFINARVRLWKPMVEEIHMLETRQAQKSERTEEQQNANRQFDNLFSAKSHAPENLPPDQRIHDTASKQSRNELPNVPMGNEEALNLSYTHAQGSAGVSMQGGGSGVSLTLGLHQNNALGLSEPFQVNAPQRFGVNIDSDADQGFLKGGFGLQTRHIGGQLLHDFVG